MTPSRTDQPPDDRPPDDAAPRWHAPPRPRSAIEPPPPPPPLPEPPPTTAAPSQRSLLDRLGPPLLTTVLLLVVGAVAWPVVRDALVTPPATPTAPVVPIRPPTSAAIPAFPTTVGCFGGQVLAAASGSAAISRNDAERRYREGYELPFRASRLATLADARLVNVGTNNSAARSRGTPTPAPTRLAWLLSFGRTTPLTRPRPARQVSSGQEFIEFTYALVDAASGETIAHCDGAGAAAKAGGFELPRPQFEWVSRRSITEAWAAGPSGGRVASWLPFTAAAALGTAITLPGNGRELVVDYYAAEADRVGERIQVVSTTHAPILRLGAEGGEQITLTDGHAARLDRLGEMTALTWQDGDLWYQIIAVRPQQFGSPYAPDDLFRIVAGLRSREGG